MRRMEDATLDLGSSFIIFGFIMTTLLVIASSVWVARDAKAKQIPITGSDYNLNTGAAAWFISCLLLWIATFPYYLYRRAAVMSARAVPTPKPGQPDVEQELRKIAKLRDDGLVTAADYEEKKRLLLGL